MGNLAALFTPEDVDCLDREHPYPEIVLDSGYVTKHSTILQFDGHKPNEIGLVYSVYDYFGRNSKIFEIIANTLDNVKIVSGTETVAVVLQQSPDVVAIKDSSNTTVATISSKDDILEVMNLYKKSGQDASDIALTAYNISGDFEHCHFCVKNQEEHVVSKVSPIYGRQSMEQNFGVRITKNTDILMVVCMCVAVEMCSPYATTPKDAGERAGIVFTPLGMPYM